MTKKYDDFDDDEPFKFDEPFDESKEEFEDFTYEEAPADAVFDAPGSTHRSMDCSG